MQKEIEIKFRVENLQTLARKLRAVGFRLKTPRTHEMNTLYDLPGQKLRRRKELLRLVDLGLRPLEYLWYRGCGHITSLRE